MASKSDFVCIFENNYPCAGGLAIALVELLESLLFDLIVSSAQAFANSLQMSTRVHDQSLKGDNHNN